MGEKQRLNIMVIHARQHQLVQAAVASMVIASSSP
jgi:hypothetical protein